MSERRCAHGLEPQLCLHCCCASPDGSESAELAAIDKRLADWPHTGWAVEDCRTLRRMVDELTKDLAHYSKLACYRYEQIDELRAKLATSEASQDAYLVELEQMRAKLAEAEQKFETAVGLLNETYDASVKRLEADLTEAKAEIARLKDVCQHGNPYTECGLCCVLRGPTGLDFIG